MCTQIGGNSLQTGSVCSRVRSALGLHANIPAAWLFVHQTIRSLAAKIAQDVLAPGAVHAAPLLPTVSKLLADPAEGTQTPTQLSFQQVPVFGGIPCCHQLGCCPARQLARQRSYILLRLQLMWHAGAIPAAVAAGPCQRCLQHALGHPPPGQPGHDSAADGCAAAGYSPPGALMACFDYAAQCC